MHLHNGRLPHQSAFEVPKLSETLCLRRLAGAKPLSRRESCGPVSTKRRARGRVGLLSQRRERYRWPGAGGPGPVSSPPRGVYRGTCKDLVLGPSTQGRPIKSYATKFPVAIRALPPGRRYVEPEETGSVSTVPLPTVKRLNAPFNPIKSPSMGPNSYYIKGQIR